ncbi:hypothetical protein AGABI2DRAFT_222260 [Agaricus bisporus var. bisporus H97]|uniref:hypothetical protein n=1 Tax=Agaricus bisporus var. bisporus (strain H97 / ATCC MYA-4626 / FGSC 10389) TaxID=936046 RepID=UPI00029F6932|nr:hypothetical protein AGABI2DRAFT_222260 [Agaricus bisporus var. bisporus H97]EKV47826.1 hypothetical protein AGABI2DRAFT_222260 [Agaricus bisporus var. bisporus H97]
MSSLSLIRQANSSFRPRFTPVAVFVGGTNGIGRGMAEAFGRHTQGKSNIVILGRNKDAADELFSTLPSPTDKIYNRDFIHCDATRMKNVETATKEILARYSRVNFLVLSPGTVTMRGRDETEEGLDTKLALHYYARWKFIQGLLPALNKASEEGESAKVFSVFSPGNGSEIDLNDLGLKTTFSAIRAGLQMPTYNDLMMEAFYDFNPAVTFIHGYPGFVRTSLFTKKSNSTLLNLAQPFMNTLLRPILTSPEDASEYMWHAIFNSTGGVFRTGSRGEDLGKKRYFGSEEAKKKLWEHTVEATTIRPSPDSPAMLYTHGMRMTMG